MIKLAVLGNPIAHSRSPEIHGLFARQFGIALTYQKVLVPEGGLALAVGELIRQGARGCNITVPFKSQALALCDEVKGDAIGLGVINTLDFADKWRGLWLQHGCPGLDYGSQGPPSANDSRPERALDWCWRRGSGCGSGVAPRSAQDAACLEPHAPASGATYSFGAELTACSENA